jgi:hypothetical protein
MVAEKEIVMVVENMWILWAFGVVGLVWMVSETVQSILNGIVDYKMRKIHLQNTERNL